MLKTLSRLSINAVGRAVGLKPAEPDRAKGKRDFSSNSSNFSHYGNLLASKRIP